MVTDKIVAVAAIVGDTQTGLKTEIALNGQVPLLDVWVFVVERIRQIEILRARLGEIRRERVRERVLAFPLLMELVNVATSLASTAQEERIR